MLAVTGGWLGARLDEAGPRLSPREQRLAVAKDVLVGAVAVSGLATAVQGMRFARQAPAERSRSRTAPPRAGGDAGAARVKRRLNALGLVALGAELGLTGVNAALNQQSFRLPPRPRLLRAGGTRSGNSGGYWM